MYDVDNLISKILTLEARALYKLSVHSGPGPRFALSLSPHHAIKLIAHFYSKAVHRQSAGLVPLPALAFKTQCCKPHRGKFHCFALYVQGN